MRLRVRPFRIDLVCVHSNVATADNITPSSPGFSGWNIG